MIRLAIGGLERMLGCLLLCGPLFFSCAPDPVSADAFGVPMLPATAAATESVTSSSSLSLSLTDAHDRPLGEQQIRWRPVFEAESTETSSAQTNTEGRLLISDLLPGVRYLFSAPLDNGSSLSQWYRVPSSPSLAAWRWVLVAEPEAHEKHLLTDAAPALQPTRLHYPSGAMGDFKSALALASAQMTILPLQINDLRPSSDVVWWVSGDFSVDKTLLSALAIDALSDFVAQGGTLVINGEWAGLRSEGAELTQALGLRLGFRLSRDTLAQDTNVLTIDNIHDHVLTRGVHTLALSRSGSVGVYNPKKALELAFAGAEHYQIVALREQHAVLAHLTYGRGRVIAVGDSSLWSDTWFQAQDNRRLWQNILSFPLEGGLKGQVLSGNVR